MWVIRTVHNSHHHVTLGQDIGNVHVTGMRTTMNDTIEIEIQMIDFGQQGIVADNLINLGITLGNPAVKLIMTVTSTGSVQTSRGNG